MTEAPTDRVYDAVISEGIEHSSATVCKAMARFCLRLSQVVETSDPVRVMLIAAANRWNDAAVAKLDAERPDQAATTRERGS